MIILIKKETKMEIRELNEADAGVLKAYYTMLINYHKDKYNDYFMKTFEITTEKYINKENAVALVAEEEGNDVGVCYGRIKIDLRGKKVFSLDGIIVRKEYRRKGIATMMLKKIYEEAKMIGAVGIELIVWGENDEALTFYKNHKLSIQRIVMNQDF